MQNKTLCIYTRDLICGEWSSNSNLPKTSKSYAAFLILAAYYEHNILPSVKYTQAEKVLNKSTLLAKQITRSKRLQTLADNDFSVYRSSVS